MNVLGIDTATPACSCALLLGNEIVERHLIAPQQHAELVLEMVDELMGEAEMKLGELDAVAFGQGPGSFTGLRIAAGVVQGLTLGAGLPAVPVSTLQALAQCALRTLGARNVLAGFDARMGEVYWGIYSADGGPHESGYGPIMHARAADQVCAPANAPPVDGEPWWGIGSAWDPYAEELRARYGARLGEVVPELLPTGRDVALLGRHWLLRGLRLDPDAVTPVYLRNLVTRRPAQTTTSCR